MLMPMLIEVEDIPPMDEPQTTLCIEDETFLKGLNTHW
jgi:hypothetical protein